MLPELDDADVLEAADHRNRGQHEHDVHELRLAKELRSRLHQREHQRAEREPAQDVHRPGGAVIRGVGVPVADQLHVGRDAGEQLEDGDDERRVADDAEIVGAQDAREDGDARESDDAVDPAERDHPAGGCRDPAAERARTYAGAVRAAAPLVAIVASAGHLRTLTLAAGRARPARPAQGVNGS